MENKNREMVISTGLKGNVAKNILLNVIGQLSDGMWENSRVMEHYWPFTDIAVDKDDNVNIIVQLPGSTSGMHDNNIWDNYFINRDKLNRDPVAIKNWFADKIKKIVAEERKDEPGRDLKFKADNNTKLNYMSSYDKDDNYRHLTVAEAYTVYNALRKKKTASK